VVRPFTLELADGDFTFAADRALRLQRAHLCGIYRGGTAFVGAGAEPRAPWLCEIAHTRNTALLLTLGRACCTPPLA
jgi:hypothetical protein